MLHQMVILVNTGASDNTFTSNTIVNATELGINIEDKDSVNNRFENNNLINSKVAEEEEQPSNTVGQSDEEEEAAADEEEGEEEEGE
jgi:hypothetical protein